jgi:hypothetical protein
MKTKYILCICIIISLSNLTYANELTSLNHSTNWLYSSEVFNGTDRLTEYPKYIEYHVEMKFCADPFQKDYLGFP